MKREISYIPPPPELEEWLGAQPPADRKALEEVWRAVGPAELVADDAYQSRKTEVWSAVSELMDEPAPEEMPRPRMRLVRPASWRWMAAAASIALLIGIAYVLRPVRVVAPNGALAEATLPDGSTVHLNSGSTLTYPAFFFGTREVELEGEAFFDVVKGDQPFVVETFNARTVVLGTEFSVRARPEEFDPTTSVVVVTGRVHVTSKSGSSEGVILTAGRGSVVAASASEPTQPSEVSVDRELAWRSGGLAFSDQSFDVIFRELERRFDTNIQAIPEIRARRFSFYRHKPTSAQAVLTELAQAAQLRYRETANGFEVYAP